MINSVVLVISIFNVMDVNLLNFIEKGKVISDMLIGIWINKIILMNIKILIILLFLGFLLEDWFCFKLFMIIIFFFFLKWYV